MAPSSAHDLGDVRARYPGNLWEAWLYGGAIGLTVVGLAAMFHAPVWAYFFAVLAGGGLFFVFFLFTPRAAVLHDEGVVVHRWLLPARALRFDAVAAAYWDFATRDAIFETVVIDSAIRLVEPSGRTLRLGARSFKRAEEFFTRIGRLCVWPGHQRRLAEFRSGAEVQFGELAVSSAGLRLGGVRCGWDELKRVGVTPARLVFHFKDRRRRKRFRFDRIPWAFTFVHLLHQQKVPLSASDGFVLTDDR